jgi:hypothetical protein
LKTAVTSVWQLTGFEVQPSPVVIHAMRAGDLLPPAPPRPAA